MTTDKQVRMIIQFALLAAAVIAVLALAAPRDVTRLVLDTVPGWTAILTAGGYR